MITDSRKREVQCMKSSRKSVVYLVLIGLVLLVTAGLILWQMLRGCHIAYFCSVQG